MAISALGQLQPNQKRLWVKESIRVFREQFFFTKFLGTSENSIVQHVTELKRTEKGDRAMIGLVSDMAGNGVVGDNELQSREEALESSWIEVMTDQLRNGVRSKGRVDNQRNVYEFRKEARDKLAHWRADITEQLMILTASGIGYDMNTDGSKRINGGQDSLTELDFASLVTPPSANRHYRFDGGDLVTGDTGAIDGNHTPRYGMLVDLAAEARTQGLKPLRIGGQDHYVYLCHPKTLAKLKKDPDFRDVIVNAGDRGGKNPIFTGSTITMDGIIIHTNNRVFNTRGANAGDKWGASGDQDGTRSMLMGCQALGYADLWGSADWYEGDDDHGNKDVISISQYFGLIKPQFAQRAGDSREDFGVMSLDLAL